MTTPWDIDKQFADLFQIGTTPEMIGVKPNVEIKNCPIEVANDIWNAALEQAAINLKKWYPDNEQTNAYCAAIRSMRK